MDIFEKLQQEAVGEMEPVEIFDQKVLIATLTPDQITDLTQEARAIARPQVKPQAFGEPADMQILDAVLFHHPNYDEDKLKTLSQGDAELLVKHGTAMVFLTQGSIVRNESGAYLYDEPEKRYAFGKLIYSNQKVKDKISEALKRVRARQGNGAAPEG